MNEKMTGNIVDKIDKAIIWQLRQVETKKLEKPETLKCNFQQYLF